MTIQQRDWAHRREGASEAGFSLFEAMVAIFLMMGGLMALAQTLYFGLSIAATSTSGLVAREKAREAIESVHTARDTNIPWAEIRNVAAPATCPAGTLAVGGGSFQNDEQPMLEPGPDGLVSTADDAGVEMLPGPDNLFGGADDIPLVGYTRQINICDDAGNPNLRRITVTIRYSGSNAFGLRRREYTLTTLISRFS